MNTKERSEAHATARSSSQLGALIFSLRAPAWAAGVRRAVGPWPALSSGGKQPDLSAAGKRPESPIDVDEDLLRERSSRYIVDHYTVLHNTVVSVVLATAGFSAASLAGASKQYGSSYPLLWMLWVASFLLCATIFAGTVVGTLAAPPMVPAITDLLVPLLLGVGEFVLFGVLAHQITGLKTISAVAEAWFTTMVVVSTSAAVAITRVIRFSAAATYAPSIVVSIDKYRNERLPADRRGALTMGVIGVAGATASIVQITWLEFVLAGCAIAGLLRALHEHAGSATVLGSAVHHARNASTARLGGDNVAARRQTGTGWPA